VNFLVRLFRVARAERQPDFAATENAVHPEFAITLFLRLSSGFAEVGAGSLVSAVESECHGRILRPTASPQLVKREYTRGDGFRNPQRTEAARRRPHRILEYQHARLVLEHPAHRVCAQVPQLAEFGGGIMPLVHPRFLRPVWNLREFCHYTHTVLPLRSFRSSLRVASSHAPSGFSEPIKNHVSSRSTGSMDNAKENHP